MTDSLGVMIGTAAILFIVVMGLLLLTFLIALTWFLTR